MAELLLLKSFSRRRGEVQETERQMLLTKKSQPRKRFLQDMDGELYMAEALGLCAVAMKKPRKERSAERMKRKVPRGGEMVTEVGPILRSKNVYGQIERRFSSFLGR